MMTIPNHARELSAQPGQVLHAHEGTGFAVMPSEGTYFVTVDIAPLGETDDAEFCQRLVREFGVAAIPVSAFYAHDPVKTVVRFCFREEDETLDAALQRLEKLTIPQKAEVQ